MTSADSEEMAHDNEFLVALMDFARAQDALITFLLENASLVDDADTAKLDALQQTVVDLSMKCHVLVGKEAIRRTPGWPPVEGERGPS